MLCSVRISSYALFCFEIYAILHKASVMGFVNLSVLRSIVLQGMISIDNSNMFEFLEIRIILYHD